MKAFFSVLLTLTLFTQSLAAASWTDRLFGWLTDLFEPTERVEGDFSAARLDSLRLSPAGLLLNEVADADTLDVSANWPYLSVDPAADLNRHRRMLDESVLLTDPTGRLPLTASAVRIVFRYDQRPVRLLAMARRFADVQEVPYDESIGQALPVGLDLPTLVVADDPVGAAPVYRDWYKGLYELTGAPVTMLHFGDPALLAGVPADWSVLNSPLRCRESETILAQAVFGAERLTGRLEETTALFPAGSGYDLEPVRGGFQPPELLGVDRTRLEAVDYQINRGIRYRAMPGAQLLVMKGGQVIYEKAYGHHTYRKQAVNPGDLYDLASVTKAAATTLAVMRLFEDGRIDLDAEVRDYLPELKRKMIGRYRVERLLSHHTGLQADIPLYGLLGRQFVADEIRDEFLLPVGPQRWLDATVPGKVRKHLTGKIDRTRRQVYRYSDLNYYLLQLIVEEIAGEPMDELLQREVYGPMRLGRLGFRPAGRFPAQQIVPTANDPWMRGGLLRGYVHDEAAALLGGVGGNAGLFGNAHDLGQLFQMLLDGGRYRGQQLFAPETVARFTSKNRFNYRALGFDRLAGGWMNVVNAGASRATFGHLGFSGTAVWADPDNELVFVLLTNRIHPDPKNERFQKMRIRGRVHRAVYRALDTFTPVS